jgi:hypothetical protein
MALALKIGTAAYEKLPADVKKEYTKNGEEYVLDVEGYEDPVALRNARDHEKTAAADAKREAAAAKAAQAAAERKLADLGDVDKTKEAAVAAARLEVETRMGTDLTKATETLEKLRSTTIETARTSAAMAIANKISTSPSLLGPRVMDRIEVVLGDDFKPTVQFKDKTGKVAALSAEDIEKEFSTNPEFAPIIKASGGSGGGGAPRQPGGGGAPRPGTTPPLTSDGKPADLSKMSAAELTAHIRAGKEANAGA